jgi:hypothetical protein
MSLGLPQLQRRKVFNQKSFDLLWKFRDANSWQSASVMKGRIKYSTHPHISRLNFHEYKDSYKRH